MPNDLKSSEIVEKLNKEFPKFSKIQLSMVRNPEYGVVLCQKAKEMLGETQDSHPDWEEMYNRMSVKNKALLKENKEFRFIIKTLANSLDDDAEKWKPPED